MSTPQMKTIDLIPIFFLTHQIPWDPHMISSWLYSHKIRRLNYNTIIFPFLSSKSIWCRSKMILLINWNLGVLNLNHVVEVRSSHLVTRNYFLEVSLSKSQSDMCISWLLTRTVIVVNRVLLFRSTYIFFVLLIVTSSSSFFWLESMFGIGV